MSALGWLWLALAAAAVLVLDRGLRRIARAIRVGADKTMRDSDDAELDVWRPLFADAFPDPGPELEWAPMTPDEDEAFDEIAVSILEDDR